mgnify:CR=1 FL=1
MTRSRPFRAPVWLALIPALVVTATLAGCTSPAPEQGTPGAATVRAVSSLVL